ncbi:MAG: OprO/OprP family phosphate-selective porin [Pseudomonadales bacterium]
MILRSNLSWQVVFQGSVLLAGWLAAVPCVGQPTSAAATEEPPSALAAAHLNDVLDAAESDGDEPRRQLIGWNAYRSPWITARLGGGFLIDYANYRQDDDSQQQMDLSEDTGVRDARFILKGRFPKLPRVSYTLGYMYNAASETWHFRQTGLMLDVPELHGQLFVGRTKEGLSTNKLMVGYQGWTNERATINDALNPILADGIKWMGRTPGGQWVYSLGVFEDSLSDKESFNKYDRQFVGRLIWLPFLQSEPERLLHLGVGYRYGESNDGAFHFRSKPESFLAQSYAIDTGEFDADHSETVAVEAYYRPGPLMFGSEYFFSRVQAPEAGDPYLHGGEIFAAWTVTGEVRPYNTRGGFFERISPARTVFNGGPGAWELIARFSYSDLDSGPIRGGKFWRITPMVNWHMSDNLRLEVVYGYGMLDRFGLEGGTHFLQSRIQFQL